MDIALDSVALVSAIIGAIIAQFSSYLNLQYRLWKDSKFAQQVIKELEQDIKNFDVAIVRILDSTEDLLQEKVPMIIKGEHYSYPALNLQLHRCFPEDRWYRIINSYFYWGKISAINLSRSLKVMEHNMTLFERQMANYQAGLNRNGDSFINAGEQIFSQINSKDFLSLENPKEISKIDEMQKILKNELEPRNVDEGIFNWLRMVESAKFKLKRVQGLEGEAHKFFKTSMDNLVSIEKICADVLSNLESRKTYLKSFHNMICDDILTTFK